MADKIWVLGYYINEYDAVDEPYFIRAFKEKPDISLLATSLKDYVEKDENCPTILNDILKGGKVVYRRDKFVFDLEFELFEIELEA